MANLSKSSEISKFPIRIYYEDTDAGGIVYHASFLRFAERGRSEFLRERNISVGDTLPDHGFHFVVRHIEIDYRAPAKLDDLLNVETSVIDLGNASFTMHQEIKRDAQTIVDLKVVLVCVNAAGKAVRVPDMLREIFSKG